jgi:hypothetical protein
MPIRTGRRAFRVVGEGALDGNCGVQGAPHMVFLRDRRTEQSHEAVAGWGRGVEPTMSQNSTVTCFISPGRALLALAAKWRRWTERYRGREKRCSEV